MMKFFNVVFSIALAGCVIVPSEEDIPEGDNTETPILEQDDAGTGGDVSADLTSPHQIDYGVVDGVLSSYDEDAFGLSLRKGETIRIEVIPEENTLDVSAMVEFYKSNYANIEKNDHLAGSAEFITFTTDASVPFGKFGIKIATVSGTGKYSLKVSATPQNDGEQGEDAPQDQDQPMPIKEGEYIGGYLGGADEWDFFTISLPVNKTITVKVTPDEDLDTILGPGTNCSSGCYIFTSSSTVNDAFKGGVESFDDSHYDDVLYKFGVGKVGKTAGTYKLTVTIN